MTKAGRYLLTGAVSAVVESTLVEKVQSVSADNNNTNDDNTFPLFNVLYRTQKSIRNDNQINKNG